MQNVCLQIFVIQGMPPSPIFPRAYGQKFDVLQKHSMFSEMTYSCTSPIFLIQFLKHMTLNFKKYDCQCFTKIFNILMRAAQSDIGDAFVKEEPRTLFMKNKKGQLTKDSQYSDIVVARKLQKYKFCQLLWNVSSCVV